ncbi:MAG: HAMP domain-containing sensor histidine kinase [Thermotaleaceae bacterium]
MSIRTRLKLSYIGMLIIPIVLIYLASIAIGSLVMEDAAFMLPGRYQEDFMKEKMNVFQDIHKSIAQNPDQFQNLSYLRHLDEELTVLNMGIVMRKNDNLLYVSPIFENKDFLEDLPTFGTFDIESHDPRIIGKQLFFLRQQDFYFENMDQGTLFLATDISIMRKYIRRFTSMMILSIFVIFILTLSLLTYAVSKSILKPLRILHHATEQIKAGNLDFHLEPQSKDEIGDLTAAFEEMRQQLKNSIEKQLQYENNRKELLSNISHDLKTPISGIKGHVEGILDGVADTEEKMERYMQTIYRKASDLDKLIDELFLYSKLDVKKIPFNFESVEINSYFQHILEDFQFDLKEQGILLSLHGLSHNIHVIADREKLKRVINNIFDNAIKYMNRDLGRIDVFLHEEEDFVRINIRDNGQGIPEQALPYVFERFYRADTSRNTAAGGSGLGLSIAKRIIEEHQGHIWAESEPNKGTHILFTLKKYYPIEGGKSRG